MLKIIKGIFGVDPTDLLPGVRDTGSFARNPLEGGMMPDLTAKMMIGEGGLRNLEEAGIPQRVSAEELKQYSDELGQYGQEMFERNSDAFTRGVEIDVNASKAMYEIPDDEVQVRKGRDINKINEAGFSEIFKADLLENAYPDIADIKLSFYNDPKSRSAGGFDPVKNVLRINRSNPYVQQNGVKKTVLHEVQHFVQAKEGLTYGENFAMRLAEEPDYQMGKQYLDKALNSPQVANDLVKMLTENPNINLNAANTQLAIKALADNPTDDAETVLAKSLGNKEMAQKFMSKARAYPALRGLLESKELAEDGYRAAFAKYSNVEGEGFANATMNRADMNQAQRDAVSVRQQLLAQGNVPGEMLPSRFEASLNNNLGYTDPTQTTIRGL